jgi:hypothetical protein
MFSSTMVIFLLLTIQVVNNLKENANECPWGIGESTKISNFATKSYVIIVKTKVKTCISNT